MMRKLFSLSLCVFIFITISAQRKPASSNNEDRGGYEIFVGLVGNPSVVEDIKWDDEQLENI